VSPEGQAGQPAGQEEGFDLAQMGHNEGNEETAILGIVEFSDFGCIHCAGFHMETYPALNTEFVASGDILWKYIPVTIGGFPNGNLAGAVGVCALELGSFAQMRDHLFKYREEWRAATPESATAIFLRYAAEMGMDATALRACLESPEPHATIQENNRIARQIGVNATPSFFVGGEMVRGAPPLDAFQNGLRSILAAAAATEGGAPAP
jgi:protein-disulfide isomerase